MGTYKYGQGLFYRGNYKMFQMLVGSIFITVMLWLFLNLLVIHLVGEEDL